MRTRLNGHEPGYEPPRTTVGLLLYLGTIAAVLLAMSYPVAVAIGIVVGSLIWGCLSVAHEMTFRTPDSERSSGRNVLAGKHGRSPHDD